MAPENTLWNDDEISSLSSKSDVQSDTIVRDSQVFNTMTSLGDVYSKRSGPSPQQSPPHSKQKGNSRASIQDKVGSEPALGFLLVSKRPRIETSPKRKLKKIKFHSNKSKGDILEIKVNGKSDDRKMTENGVKDFGELKQNLNFLSVGTSPKNKNLGKILTSPKQKAFNGKSKNDFVPISNSHFSGKVNQNGFVVPEGKRGDILKQTSLHVRDDLGEVEKQEEGGESQSVKGNFVFKSHLEFGV